MNSSFNQGEGIGIRALPFCFSMKPVAFALATSLAMAWSFAAAPASAGGPFPDPKLEAGRSVFDQHCAACHGVKGDGNGPAAVWLFPKPRNFNSGLFKIKSMPAGFLPSDEDLLRTVTLGMPGSSMPSFTYLSEQQRRDVVQYVKSLTSYADASGKRVNFFEEERIKGQVGQPISVPPEPPVTVQSLAHGQTLYGKLNCLTCHGLTGEGMGPSAPSLKDFWGFSLMPRDFNTGAFRGGHTGRDLYLRIATGLAGTPMPVFDDKMVSPEDRWALVHYVQSLRRKEIEINDILQPADNTIRAQRVNRLPANPAEASWERLDPARIPLNPLWPEPELIPAVAVRAVHDGKRIAILCQWKDAVDSGAPIRIQDFQDGMALQFSLTGKPGFLGMGDANNPVNLWYWRAGWQQEVDGPRPDMNTRYASMHVDTYFQPEQQFRTAKTAGNILAQDHSRSPIEDANARGFGTLKTQPPEGQNVDGRGIWRDGFWNVVFVRELKSRNADDVKFDFKNAVPVAFAVWDGEQRDRNGRKVISNWYKLILEP